MKEKKIPERRCIGCGESFPKSSLIRIVRTPEGEPELDVTGRKNGRGAYICPRRECLRLAVKKKRISSNLGVEPTEEVLERLTEEISNAEEKGNASV